MAMESVLQQLESRIEELVEAYRGAVSKTTELATKVASLEVEIDELTAKLSTESDAHDQVAALEKQRDALASRLEKVLGLIDGVLAEKS
jgi:predicted  nucleic acid-binding Zn-ribbon protein